MPDRRSRLAAVVAALTAPVRGLWGRLRSGVAVWRRRLRRIERREIAEFRRWLEHTDNLVRLSALLFVPGLLALVTALSNALPQFSFLLFPPLASGAYGLFADPEGRYADPVRFVVGVTGGAACGWAAIEVETLLFGASAARTVSPGSAAVSILLAGVVTWALDVEVPSAFSAALLVLAAPTPWRYVGFTLLASTLIAAVFAVWRESVYEERAGFLYGTVTADDHVLVPLRGPDPTTPALFGARLAEAHEAGKVVLLDVVDDERVAATERTLLDHARGTGDRVDRLADVDPAVRRRADEAVERVETTATRLRTEAGVPVEVAVATGDPERVVGEVAHATNCDLIVTPYETAFGGTASFVRAVFRTDTDAVTLRAREPREEWRRVLVLVARPGDTAHAMVDFAARLAGGSGTVAVCSCIDREAERRRAEDKLAKVVETVDASVETRVARADVLSFVERNAAGYDLVLLGASRDRSAASRLLSPPTFHRVEDVEADVAVVDRGDVR
ncbi:HPP family protein [Halobaculum sp. MBLA0147]|uniref:universal stress protein n=1 Tax=Halobaculum sp. MBLA0147 TaxID=3079934 RepID=UPI003525A9E5